MQNHLQCTLLAESIYPLQKVKDELAHIQSLGVISKVDTPTRCAGMMVALKKDKKVRICVNLYH